MNPFVSIIDVETPQVVGSFPSEDFAAPGQPNPSGTDPYSFLQSSSLRVRCTRTSDRIRGARTCDREHRPRTLENPLVREQLIRQFLRPHRLSIQFPLLEDVAAHEYNQDHQERIVATVQPHVIFKEIPELQVVKRIQEQIFGHSEVLPQERVEQHTAKQICARANPPDSGDECRHRFGEPANSYTVETSQVVGSFKTLRTRAQPSYRAKKS